MICSKCGTENVDGSKFCVFCGQTFDGEDVPEESAGTPEFAEGKGESPEAGTAFTGGEPAAVESNPRPVEDLYKSPYIKSGRDPVQERQYKIKILVCILVMLVSLAAIIVIFLNESDRRKHAQELSQPAVTQETTAVQEAPTQAELAQEATTAATEAETTQAAADQSMT